MSCCGQHRSVMHVQASAAAPSQVAMISAEQHRAAVALVGSSSAGSFTAPGSEVTLQYRERTRMQVRGPLTGRNYLFEPARPTVVDARDADMMLRSRQFLRVAAHPR